MAGQLRFGPLPHCQRRQLRDSEGPMKLIAHPERPPASVRHVRVDATLTRGLSVIDYKVEGAIAMDPPGEPVRADNLWQHTCFELFIRPVGGDAYYEFNFSPSTAWAAYRLDGYRAPLTRFVQATPRIEPRPDGVHVEIDLSALPEGPWQVAITAVAKEADGRTSYWALAHPAGGPDFHHPDGFILKV